MKNTLCSGNPMMVACHLKIDNPGNTTATQGSMTTPTEITPTPASTPVSAVSSATAPSLSAVRGLANLGNTCYLNSALQALRHSRAFMEYIASNDWRRWEHPERDAHQLLTHGTSLLCALAEPVTPGSVVVPGNFVRTFVDYAGRRSDEFRFGGQADSAEALQILLDALHTQISREVVMSVRSSGGVESPASIQYTNSLESWASFFRKEYSALLDMFYGQSQSRIVCERCGNISERYEPWNVLKVAIPGSTSPGALAPSLAECIADAMKTEKIDDYACDKCAAAEAAILRVEGLSAGKDSATLDATLAKHSSKGPAHKEHRISRFPSNLIVSLKRFTNIGQKVRARIPYDPDNITLANWRAWPALQASALASYRVYATIEHLGSCRGGHYIMRGRDTVDGTWRIYDDSHVSVSPIGGAAGPDTYILFLERKQ